MMLGFWELVIIAVLLGVPLLLGGLIVWLVVRASRKRESSRRLLPGQAEGTTDREQR